MRVLAVDDDPMTLMIVAGVVEAAGHECVTAADGLAGWELLVSSGADVVISDWRMPGLDGLELCRRIRAELPATPTSSWRRRARTGPRSCRAWRRAPTTT